MDLSNLTDRELTGLLGFSLYVGHALKTAARAEQKSRLWVGRGTDDLAEVGAFQYTAAYRRAFDTQGPCGLIRDKDRTSWRIGRAWSAARCDTDPEPWMRPRRERLQPCFLSESARAEMHVPRRRGAL